MDGSGASVRSEDSQYFIFLYSLPLQFLLRVDVAWTIHSHPLHSMNQFEDSDFEPLKSNPWSSELQKVWNLRSGPNV